MECTQRLECTQDLNDVESEVVRVPEQVGFLGICGTKYPVKKGPNKIGRDPQMCSILLKLDSISRTHAVINVLNATAHMLMDLDSANKTRLNNKILSPYIPYPLNNGDTVQFGDVFGIYRLLEEETDLPMTQAIDLPATQAIDIPDTPVPKHTRINKCGVTTVPESPDVSDRDDSFIMPSQPQPKANQQFKSPNNKFMKQSGKTVAIQPVGSHQIDNVYWNSNKKSLSLNESDISDDAGNNMTHQIDDIHEMETQPPYSIHTADTQAPNASKESIYSANTQFPNVSTDSIYSAATQHPDKVRCPSIHDLDTQIAEHLPSVQKISGGEDMQFDIFTANKENISIHNAETQMFTINKSPVVSNPKKIENDEDIFVTPTQFPFERRHSPNDFDNDVMVDQRKKSTESTKTVILPPETGELMDENLTTESTSNSAEKSDNSTKYKVNTTSDEEILFEEVDGQSFEDDFYSQPLIPSEDFELQNGEPVIPLSQTKLSKKQAVFESKENKGEPVKAIESDITILPTQKLAPSKGNKTEPLKPIEGDDITILPTQKLAPSKENKTEPLKPIESDDIRILTTQKLAPLSKNEDDLTDCEDDSAENVLNNNKYLLFSSYGLPGSPDIPFEDMATQVLKEDKTPKNTIADNVPNENPEDDVPFDEIATQVLEEDQIMLQIEKKNSSQDVNNAELSDVIDLSDDIGDMPTQVLKEEKNIEDLPTQVLAEDVPEKLNGPLQFSQEMISPFKIPVATPLKNKKRDSLKKLDSEIAGSSPIISNVNAKSKKISTTSLPPAPTSVVIDDDEDNYYQATQEIIDDLDSQQLEASPEIVKIPTKTDNNQNKLPNKSQIPQNDTKEKVLQAIKSDSNEVAPLKRGGSDSAEEKTPKKVRPSRLIFTELPDSQEIKTSVALTSRTAENTESSSESEVEQNSEEMTPITFRKKQRKKKSPLTAKIDLIKKFEATSNALPTRIITRARKPTKKLQESDILKPNKPRYLTEQDDEVDKEIITENITRWKIKNDKKTKIASNEDNNGNKPNNDVKAEKIEKICEKVVKELSITLVKEEQPNSKEVKQDKPLPSKKKANKNQKPKYKTKDEVKITIEAKKSEIKDNVVENVIKNETPKTTEIDQSMRKTRRCRRNRIESDEEIKVLPTDAQVSTSSERGKHRQARSNSKTSYTDNETSMKSVKDTKSSTVDLTNTDNETNKKSKVNKVTKDKSKAKPIESKTKTRGKRNKSVNTTEDSAPQTTVRRSRRPKTASQSDTIDKYLVDMNTPMPKSNKIITLGEQDLSTVYNISSGSSDEIVTAKKRPANTDIKVPSPKRTRSSSRVSLRATPARQARTQHVLFTAFNNDEVKKRLEKLGAVIVTDVKACTVVVTLSIKRTFKLLCAVGLGVPIVGPEWVQACSDTNTIVDPWQYLIKDEANEKRFHFNLRQTLVGKRGFLKGYNVSCTPNVMPSSPEMKLIVECSGGTWRASGPNWICVSCSTDKALWPPLTSRGANVVSTEFILSGVLKQIADVDTTRVC